MYILYIVSINICSITTCTYTVYIIYYNFCKAQKQIYRNNISFRNTHGAKLFK